MTSNGLCLTVDKYDLDEKIWTCSKYQELHNDCNTSCSLVFNSSIKFRVHVRKTHRNSNFPTSFKCPVANCKLGDKLFARIQHLQNHYDCIHRKEHDFQCSVCHKTFSSSKTWSRHAKNCSSGTLKCDYCSRTFSGFSSLSRHCRERHLQEIEKKCSVSLASNLPPKSFVDAAINVGDSAVKYYLVPVQNVVMQSHEDSSVPNTSCGQIASNHTSEISTTTSLPVSEEEQVPYSSCQVSKRAKQTPKLDNHLQHAASQANIWCHTPSQTPPMWCNDPPVSKNTARSWQTDPDQDLPDSYPELRKPPVRGYDESIPNKQFLSEIDNITTQTDEFWGLNEFSTQTDTEQNSFGTQTRDSQVTSCSNDQVLDSFISECDLVEYLDGEVQTENYMKTDSATLASQTSISAENFSNDRSCGVERLDRDCQTNYFTNSTHTQTKMRRERSLIVVDGLNSETQTTTPEQITSIYNESFTQTIDF